MSEQYPDYERFAKGSEYRCKFQDAPIWCAFSEGDSFILRKTPDGRAFMPPYEVIRNANTRNPDQVITVLGHMNEETRRITK